MIEHHSYAPNLSSCETKPEKKIKLLLHNCLSSVHNCNDQSYLHIILHSSNIDELSYIRLYTEIQLAFLN